MTLTIINSLQDTGVIAIDDESGQGLVEYGLILAFVVVVAIVALTFLGSDISLALSSIGNSL